jgi:hypothetical protein
MELTRVVLALWSERSSGAGEDCTIDSGAATNDVITGGLIVVQNMAIVAEKLPVVGSAAVLLLQLIDLCDAYRCNKRLFQALKARMQFMYGLYFAEGGMYGYYHSRRPNVCS